jgi:hypothetical protein
MSPRVTIHRVDPLWTRCLNSSVQQLGFDDQNRDPIKSGLVVKPKHAFANAWIC